MHLHSPTDLLNVEQYCESLTDPAKQECMRLGFRAVHWLFENMQALFRSDVPAPEIVVFTNRAPFIGTLGDRIQVTDEFLDVLYCGQFPPVPADILFTPSRTYNIISMLMWSFAHEYAHAFRKHRDVSGPAGDSVGAGQEPTGVEKCEPTEKAFEWDADNVATAMLYREMQHQHQHEVTDGSIRAYCLFIVYWTLRVTPDVAAGSTSHLAFAERIRAAVGKLRMMTKHQPTDSNDVHLSGELAERLTQMLLMCLDVFDKDYSALRGLEFENERVADKWSRVAPEHVLKWQEIKGAVAEMSKTRT